MKRFKARQIYLVFMLVLGVFLITGCGNWEGGDGTTAPVAPVAPVAPGAIIPGDVCVAAGGDPTIPTVISSNPTSGNLLVTTSTTGAGGNKLITATFSLAMDPLTIVSPATTFTVIETLSTNPVVGTVTMNATNTIATFTTAAALTQDTEYTVSITTDAESATNVAMACSYEWNFRTNTPPPASGQPPVDLGTASTYGIFASADAAITLNNPSVLVDGDAGLMDGAGACNNCTPATVTGAIENGTAAAAQAQIDIQAAYTDAATRATDLCTLAANTEIAGPQGACGGYTDPPGSLGGSGFNTYLPGLYWSATTIGLGVGKTIVLDAQGDSDAVFIFQAGSAITTGTDSIVILANNAQAKNVWWTAGTAATLGVRSIFKGSVIALAAQILVLNGDPGFITDVEGRLFSLGAAITVDHDATITVPAP